MNNLENLLSQLENKISNSDVHSEAISKVNVAWHIEHALMVLNNSIDTIAASNPKDYKWSFNFTRIVVFTMNSFPRGKARAPKSVRPTAQASQSSLQSLLETTQTKIKTLDTISKDQFMVHPFFGNIKLKQTSKFLEIHTKHHLKIIEDILKQ